MVTEAYVTNITTSILYITLLYYFKHFIKTKWFRQILIQLKSSVHITHQIRISKIQKIYIEGKKKIIVWNDKLLVTANTRSGFYPRRFKITYVILLKHIRSKAVSVSFFWFQFYFKCVIRCIISFVHTEEYFRCSTLHPFIGIFFTKLIDI